MPIRGVILCLSVIHLFGQYRAVSPKKQEPIGTPKSKPEPQRELKRAPLELFSDLLSSKSSSRARALNELIESGVTDDSAPVLDVALRVMNLDDDADTEYIFTINVELPHRESFVMIVDHHDGR